MTSLPERRKRHGYINPERVARWSFWTATLCVLIAVVASVLAIWEFTGTDVLWRTVATCAVVGLGVVIFAWLNSLFDPSDDLRG